MHFIFRSSAKRCIESQQRCRTLVNAAAGTIKCVRDRGLDHAVEREKNLRPLLNLKDFIRLEPSKCLPISIITQNKDTLRIPIRPIEFIRKYPSIFEEFLPGGIGIHPHIKLTPEVLDLDAEEQLVYQSDSYKQDLADRLLKLLMLSRINKIPLRVLDILKWDLGLPQDFAKNLVPGFPDYFRVVGSKDSSSGPEAIGELELVCWSSDHAVSVLERKAMKGETGYSKCSPISFPMKFSRGMEIDKKVKKWMDEWQKSPYVSPYENATHLSSSSDESDRWAAAVLHEVLNLFVAKKAERENVLSFGEHLGIRSRFKRVLLHHPGIFYLSGKMGIYTVVLREAYKRGLLVESNPLMTIRNRYVHLMHTVKEDRKAIAVPSTSKQKKETVKSSEKEGDGKDSEEENASYDLSGSDIENISDDCEDDENWGRRGGRGKVAVHRGKMNNKRNLGSKTRLRKTEGERTMGKHGTMTKDKTPPRVDIEDSSDDCEDNENGGRRGERGNVSVHRGKTNKGRNLSSKARLRNTEGERVRGSLQHRSDSPRSRRRLLTEKRSSI